MCITESAPLYFVRMILQLISYGIINLQLLSANAKNFNS
jgi:hypothetical protein